MKGIYKERTNFKLYVHKDYNTGKKQTDCCKKLRTIVYKHKKDCRISFLNFMRQSGRCVILFFGDPAPGPGRFVFRRSTAPASPGFTAAVSAGALLCFCCVF